MGERSVKPYTLWLEDIAQKFVHKTDQVPKGLSF